MVPSRRTVLRSLGTAGLAAVAGCLAFGGPSFEDECAEGELATGDAAPGSVSGAWPEFAHDSGNTGYAPDLTGPTDPATAWRYATCDPMDEAAPTVADGTVYVANTQRPSVYAFDAATGDIEWTVEEGGSQTAPAVTDDAVYVSGRSVLALDRADGSVRWRYDGDEQYPSASAATIVDGVVYAGGGIRDGTLYALDARSGEAVWTADTGGESLQDPPAVAGGRVYITDFDGRLRSFDAASGGDRRTLTEEGERVLQPPVVADGTVYAAFDGGAVRALAPDGTRRWTATVGDTGVDAVPVVGDGAVHLVDDGGIVTLEAQDGSEQWRRDVGEPLGTPVRGGETLYVGVAGTHGDGTEGPTGAIRAFDAGDGSNRFRFETRGIPAGEGGPYAGTRGPVAVADGVLFAATGAGDVLAVA